MVSFKYFYRPTAIDQASGSSAHSGFFSLAIDTHPHRQNTHFKRESLKQTIGCLGRHFVAHQRLVMLTVLRSILCRCICGDTVSSDLCLMVLQCSLNLLLSVFVPLLVVLAHLAATIEKTKPAVLQHECLALTQLSLNFSSGAAAHS